MELSDQKIKKAFDWLTLESGENFLAPAEHCQTRDVFQGRLDHMSREMEMDVFHKNVYALLTAIVGELGNNAFDHNFGSWKDTMGIYFVYDLKNRFVVIADRGQGVLATLRRVRPELSSENEAIKLAFTEIISGRAPEQRGNGLKFVEAVVRSNGLKVFFYSNDGSYIVNNGLREGDTQPLHGVLAVLSF